MKVPVFGRVGVGKDLLYIEEDVERCVSTQTQFDVFNLAQNKHYLRETIPKAVFFYLKWLLPLVYSSSISETLTQIKSLNFGLLDEKHVKTCINWILEQVLNESMTDPQRLYLCIILGHLKKMHLPLPLRKKQKTVDACDRLLQCLIASTCVYGNFLSASDLHLLEKIAVTLVENSSSPGWLTLAAHFYPYIGIDYILREEKAKGWKHRYDDKEYHEMIGLLLCNIKIKNSNDQVNHTELLHLMLKSAPSIDDALIVFTSPNVDQILANEDERVSFFVKFYERQLQNNKKSAGAQLVDLNKIPEDIRKKMKRHLFSTVLEYSKSENTLLEEQHENAFLALIVNEGDLDMDQVLEVLMELSKSESVALQNLLLRILDSKRFEQDWHETPLEDKEKICKSWVITRLRNEKLERLGGADKIALVYKAIDSIMRCFLNKSKSELVQNVFTYVLENDLKNEDATSVLQAFASIEHCVADVQGCYKSHVRKILKETPMVVKTSSNFLVGYSKSRCVLHFSLFNKMSPNASVMPFAFPFAMSTKQLLFSYEIKQPLPKQVEF